MSNTNNRVIVSTTDLYFLVVLYKKNSEKLNIPLVMTQIEKDPNAFFKIEAGREEEDNSYRTLEEISVEELKQSKEYQSNKSSMSCLQNLRKYENNVKTDNTPIRYNSLTQNFCKN